MISFSRIVFVIGVLGLICTASLRAEEDGKTGEQPAAPKAEYVPDDSAFARLDGEDALEILLDMTAPKPANPIVLGTFDEPPRIDYLVFPMDGGIFTSGARVTNLHIKDGKIAFLLNRDDRGPDEYLLSDLPQIVVTSLKSTFSGVPLSDKWIFVCRSSSQSKTSKDYSRLCARLVADSLYTLVHSSRYARESEKTFQEVVSQYSSGVNPPAFPEAARRFRVQAEFAFEQKRLEDAARLYREALKAAPWWPQGYMNRALILGELKRYPQAISDMKRFLALEPNHAGAREAQDRIYLWESMTSTGQSAVTKSPRQESEPCRSVFGCARQQLQR